MVFLCETNYSAPTVHRSTAGWGGGLVDDPADRNGYAPWSDASDDLATSNNAQDDGDFDPASITVQMSIWQELCAGQNPKENESQVKDREAVKKEGVFWFTRRGFSSFLWLLSFFS